MTEERVPYAIAAECPEPEWKVIGLLAIARYLVGQISESLLARKLGLDRLETRHCVQQFLDTAIENAQVPIKRITTLEQRCATLTGQVSRLQLEREDLLGQIARRDIENHQLRNQVQSASFLTEELREDLRAERQHLIELARQLGLEEKPNDQS